MRRWCRKPTARWSSLPGLFPEPRRESEHGSLHSAVPQHRHPDMALFWRLSGQRGAGRPNADTQCLHAALQSQASSQAKDPWTVIISLLFNCAVFGFFSMIILFKMSVAKNMHKQCCYVIVCIEVTSPWILQPSVIIWGVSIKGQAKYSNCFSINLKLNSQSQRRWNPAHNGTEAFSTEIDAQTQTLFWSSFNK